MGRLACFRKRNKESGRPASHGKSGRWAVGCDPRSGHDSRKCSRRRHSQPPCGRRWSDRSTSRDCLRRETRSEEHTSELQSHSDLVCRLLLEKKKKKYINK